MAKRPKKEPTRAELDKHRHDQVMRDGWEKRQNDQALAKAIAARHVYKPAPMPDDGEIDKVLSTIRGNRLTASRIKT